MTPTGSVAVIGAGIIGTAVAREFARSAPGARVVLFDKEDRVAAHQTGHNSGVVHAGLYYEPGGLKARLCRRGTALLRAVCAERAVPFEACGKVVVARDAAELGRLRAIHERAVANGVPGVAMLDAAALRDVEPGVLGVAALHSPTTAIVDYGRLTEALAADFRDAGGTLRLSTPVRRITEDTGGTMAVHTAAGPERFDLVVACAGLQSDRLARASGQPASPSIVPFFGQYFILDQRYADAVRGLVYPVPDPAYPFLGVHITRRVDGALMIGPNAFLSFGREGYRGLGLNVRDSLAVAVDPGFWRFAAHNLSAAGRELGGVISIRRFVDGAAEFAPALAGATGRRATRGIRAQAMRRDGTLCDDFVIQRRGRALFVRNAPSPGATSSLAIAEHLVARAREAVDEA
jgi:L-2-hydroxyglutarate oxidase LhgO